MHVLIRERTELAPLGKSVLAITPTIGLRGVAQHLAAMCHSDAVLVDVSHQDLRVGPDSIPRSKHVAHRLALRAVSHLGLGASDDETIIRKGLRYVIRPWGSETYWTPRNVFLNRVKNDAELRDRIEYLAWEGNEQAFLRLHDSFSAHELNDLASSSDCVILRKVSEHPRTSKETLLSLTVRGCDDAFDRIRDDLSAQELERLCFSKSDHVQQEALAKFSALEIAQMLMASVRPSEKRETRDVVTEWYDELWHGMDGTWADGVPMAKSTARIETETKAYTDHDYELLTRVLRALPTKVARTVREELRMSDPDLHRLVDERKVVIFHRETQVDV